MSKGLARLGPALAAIDGEHVQIDRDGVALYR
jgi:hypothetical protein